MKLTCKCGAYIEINECQSSHRDAFLAAHVICLQPEVHNHQHLNLDEAFWLNTFAGAAMQGILASNTTSTGIEALPSACVHIAKALLKDLEAQE